MDSSSIIKLTAPAPDLAELSFCGTNADALEQWGSELPLANMQQTAEQLSIATDELARLDIGSKEKLSCLETLRPLVHYICARLDRTYWSGKRDSDMLTQAAQHMQSRICDGYKCVLLTSLKTTGLANADKDMVGKAVHRLISDLSRTLLRALQNYASLPGELWLELNQCYAIAEQLEIANVSINDSENHNNPDLSITDAYLRAALISSCKPNQLPQQQLTLVFNALESWTGLVTLTTETAGALLVVDLAADRAPSYAKLSSVCDSSRAIKTEVLAYELDAYQQDVDGALEIPSRMPTALLKHLAEAWSVMQTRNFRRLNAQGVVRLCVGLRDVHYFLSGGVEFAGQISGTDALLRREINPFLDVTYERSTNESTDPWSDAHDLKVRIPNNPNIADPERILLAGKDKETGALSTSEYRHFETVAIDTSPGGYCIEWQETLPSNAQVGELVALREEHDARWCVAVTRWLTPKQGKVQMGLELLSPRAIPVAIRAIQKRGGPTDFARALLLPEIEAINQSATLVTPRLPFVAGQKIHIQRQGIQATGQLIEAERITESVNQFTFRMLDGYLESSSGNRNMDALSAITREDTTQGS